MNGLTYKRFYKQQIAVVVSAISLIVAGATISPVHANNLEDVFESGRVLQYANSIATSQSQGNTSIIQQIGDNNRASVVQSRSANYQLGNFAHIYQRGNQNQASIQQENGSNIGIILQVGNNHVANIKQLGNSFSLDANIHQIGFSSDITLSQSGSGLRSISVEQQNFSGQARPVAIDTY
ncbi:hypothetical protein BB497_03920 [Halomonas sp. GFAJ-1]|nr:hypothetical protein [Halomonas sp. GFAJ-1]AVI61906.1 hypothetical protein BB497_03920 [Halomonas sp. GFAJ-1]